jgi:hypothetical protein
MVANRSTMRSWFSAAARRRPAAPMAEARRRSPSKFGEGGGQTIGIARGHEQPDPAVVDLVRDATDLGGDDGHAGSLASSRTRGLPS